MEAIAKFPFVSEACAAIPRRVMQSEAYRALPDWAVRVLLAFACVYNGANNGDLTVNSLNFKRLGVRARWHVRASAPLLEIVGLIKRTGRGAGKENRFAIAWVPVDCGSAQSVTEQVWCANDNWEAWEKPRQWSGVIRFTKTFAKRTLRGQPVDTPELLHTCFGIQGDLSQLGSVDVEAMCT